MINPTENRLKAIIGTVLFHIGLLLCFVFMGLTYQVPPPAEEGITINFGYQDFGSDSEQQEQMIEEKKYLLKNYSIIILLLKMSLLRVLKRHLQPNQKSS